MNTNDSTLESSVPSLFQIAAFFEDFFPSEGLRQSTRDSINKLPFAEYMLNPEKLMTVLRGAHETTALPPPAPVAKKSVRPAVARKPAPVPKADEAAETELASLPKKIEFLFTCPTANSVKLAGDFTNWEAAPIEMMRSRDGVWFTVVPLKPGSYSYRFIVDGQWQDDPAPLDRVANPFGSQNAVIHVG